MTKNKKKFVEPYLNKFIMDKNDTILYQDFLNKVNRTTDGTLENLKASNTQTDNNIYYIFSEKLDEINLIISNYSFDTALRGDITTVDERNRLREQIHNTVRAIINRYNIIYNEISNFIPRLTELTTSNMPNDNMITEFEKLRNEYKLKFENNKYIYLSTTFPFMSKNVTKAQIIDIVNKTILHINKIITDKDETMDKIINSNENIKNIQRDLKKLKEDEIENTGFSSQSNEVLILSNMKKNNLDLLKKIGELKSLFDKNKDNIKSLDKITRDNLNKDLKHTNNLIINIELHDPRNNVLILINEKIEKIKEKWTDLFNQFNGYLKLTTDYIGGLIIKSKIDKLLLSDIFPKSYLNSKMKYKL